MLIGVISDTHGGLPKAALDAFAGCDWIIHAGDICGQRILWELETVAPVIAVMGNCDWDDYGPTVHYTAAPLLDDVRFKIVHKRSGAALMAPETRVVVFGHTHIPCVEWQQGVLWFNPGSATEPRGGHAASIGFIELDDGLIKDAHIHYL